MPPLRSAHGQTLRSRDSTRLAFAGRHIRVLVDYWTCNARIADLCRRRGVAMLARPHSTPYIQLQLSFLRVYADTWIGKPGLVHPLADYVEDHARFKRCYIEGRPELGRQPSRIQEHRRNGCGH